MSIDDHGSWARLFVSNMLNGTVTRLDLQIDAHGITVQHKVSIANGYTQMPNAAALIPGPTGIAYDAKTDTLFVASTADNEVFAIHNAGNRSTATGRGQLLFAGAQLRGPLALRLAPNGHLLAANGDAVNAAQGAPSAWIPRSTGPSTMRSSTM